MKAELYESLPDLSLKCTACRRYCRLKSRQAGFCGVRKNIGCDLGLLVHSLPMAVNIDPIEKKPILHAYPGSRILSFGTAGCNFACKFCQNYQMSQRREVVGKRLSPEEVVDSAIRNNCQGIAYTYNEPTIFIEFAEDVGKLAHEKGLFNIFVTNGYETPEAVQSMKRFLDFATIDFKGNASVDFYRKYISIPDPWKIYETLELLRDTDIHVEITDLVVTDIGEDLKEAESMIDRILDIFGPDMPLSFLRFHPDFLLRHLDVTSVESLMKHYGLARQMGMKYVYVGNVPWIKEQNTYCPKCGTLLVERNFLRTTKLYLNRDSTCPSCGYNVPFLLKEADEAQTR